MLLISSSPDKISQCVTETVRKEKQVLKATYPPIRKTKLLQEFDVEINGLIVLHCFVPKPPNPDM